MLISGNNVLMRFKNQAVKYRCQLIATDERNLKIARKATYRVSHRDRVPIGDSAYTNCCVNIWSYQLCQMSLACR